MLPSPQDTKEMAHVRGFGSFLFGLLVLVLLGAIGVGIYDAGLQQGIAQSASVPAGAVPYYAYGFHGGFGLFGLLFPILFLFLIFGLARAAFRGGRGGWGGGWGHHGYDRDAWMQERDSRMADLHRRLHEEAGSSGTTTGTPPGPGSAGRSS
jgi:hypothetical protein